MPAHAFDAVAPFYDALARLVFGKSLMRAQAVHLPLIPDGSEILIIGGGSGRILTKILEARQPAHILYLEASAKMLGQARKRLARHPAAHLVDFRLGTETDLHPGEQFDVVLTPFFLDLFSPAYLPGIMQILYDALRPGGLWLVTDFVQPGPGIRQSFSQGLYSLMYGFFRVTCGISARQLPDWETQLHHLGLVSGNSAYFYHGLIRSLVLTKKTDPA